MIIHDMTVSAIAKQRDHLRDDAHAYLDDGVDFLELEHQPKL